MLAPPGRRSSAITLSCLDPAVALRGGLLPDFAFEAFLAARTLDQPRTFFAGFDWAARAIFTEGLFRVGPFFDCSGVRAATALRPAFPIFEEGAATWLPR